MALTVFEAGRPGGMSQTSFIFASVFVAYIVYITIKGDLAKWLGVFGLAGSPAAPALPSVTVPALPGAASIAAGAAP